MSSKLSTSVKRKLLANMADKQKINVELLNKCDNRSISTFLHKIVDEICLKSRPLFSEYSTIWTLQEWWEVKELCTDVLKDAIRETWDKDKLYQELGDLCEEYKTHIQDVINSRRSDLKHQLLADSHAISQAVLTDFDWKVKLVMSSDKISSVQEPVVSVDISVTGSSRKQLVSVELSREELKNLINSLEAANKVLVQLKS